MKVKWVSVNDGLPEGNLIEGVVCLTYPVPKCATFGYFTDKDGKKQCGFHDFDIKLSTYKVTHWCLFPYPDTK